MGDSRPINDRTKRWVDEIQGAHHLGQSGRTPDENKGQSQRRTRAEQNQPPQAQRQKDPSKQQPQSGNVQKSQPDKAPNKQPPRMQPQTTSQNRPQKPAQGHSNAANAVHQGWSFPSEVTKQTENANVAPTPWQADLKRYHDTRHQPSLSKTPHMGQYLTKAAPQEDDGWETYDKSKWDSGAGVVLPPSTPRQTVKQGPLILPGMGWKPKPKPVQQEGVWEEYIPALWDSVKAGAASASSSKPVATPAPAPPVHNETKDCIICTETRRWQDFPYRNITNACDHSANTCNSCMQTHIRTTFEGSAWHAALIKCPECSKVLSHEDLSEWADRETFARINERIANEALTNTPGFVSCLNPACKSGHIHDIPSSMFVCTACKMKYCLEHKVPWHEELSCDEYDVRLRNPEGFRSALDRAIEEEENRARLAEKHRQELEEADRQYAQSLLDKEAAEEAERVAECERAARREQEAREQAAREREERARAEKRRKEAEEAIRHQQENRQSERTVSQMSKPCPKCRSPIERDAGCLHMTCSVCRHEFFWCCLVKYPGQHTRACPQDGSTIWAVGNRPEERAARLFGGM